MYNHESIHLYTIPTQEIPYRLKRIIHYYADAIVYNGGFYMVLIADGEENNRYIIRQYKEIGINCFTGVTSEELNQVGKLYFERLEVM